MLILIYSDLFHHLPLYFVFGFFSLNFFFHFDFQLGWLILHLFYSFCYYSGNYTFYFWALIRYYIDILLDFSWVFKLDKSKSVISYVFLFSNMVQPQKLSDSAICLFLAPKLRLFCHVFVILDSCSVDIWYLVWEYLRLIFFKVSSSLKKVKQLSPCRGKLQLFTFIHLYLPIFSGLFFFFYF